MKPYIRCLFFTSFFLLDQIIEFEISKTSINRLQRYRDYKICGKDSIPFPRFNIFGTERFESEALDRLDQLQTFGAVLQLRDSEKPHKPSTGLEYLGIPE